MGVGRIVHDERTPQTIAVLSGQVTVIPEGTLKEVRNYQEAIFRGNLPAWSGTWKSYRKEFPLAIGHWFTNAGPSAQLVPFWKKPCQC